MNIRCGCGKRMVVSDALAGKNVQCPDCGERIFVQADRFAESAGTAGVAVPRKPRGAMQGAPEQSKYAADPGYSFGEQAARFSLYVPLVVFGIGICTLGNRGEAGVAVVVAIINLTLIAAGFILGIVALVSMRRFGRDRILGRALGGIVLNGIVLSGFLAVVWVAKLGSDISGKVSGHWRIVSGPTPAAGKIDITFSGDNTFHMTTIVSGDKPVDMGGQWSLSRDRVISVRIDRVDAGDSAVVGREMGLGRVRSADDRRLVLMTDHGDEIYERVP